MNQLTPEQVANFVYWILETNNLRGIKPINTPHEKLNYIELLVPVFLSKYPDGILTGWN